MLSQVKLLLCILLLLFINNFYIFGQTNKTVMRKLKILKALVDLFFFLSVIAMVAVVLVLPIMFTTKDVVDIPITIGGHVFLLSSNDLTNLTSNIELKGILPFLVMAYFGFVMGIFYLRKLLSLFEKKIIFEQESILLLYKIGEWFLYSSLFTAVPLFIYNLLYNKNVNLDLSSGFSSFLFTLSLGLFFMVLSEVFTIAKNMKEENELTV